MRPAATDDARSVVYVSVCLSFSLPICVLGTRVSYVRTAEPIEMPLRADSRGPTEQKM